MTSRISESSPQASVEALSSETAARSRRRWGMVLLVGVVVQAAVLLGMILFKAGPLLSGKIVMLKVEPVDPRDMFRGDYVTLQYECSRVPPGGIPGIGSFNYDRRKEWQGAVVYALLEQEKGGELWRVKSFSTQRPAEGVFLRGTIVDWGRIQYGIESFYVQEGTGSKYEEAVQRGGLQAEVAVDAGGHAVLRNLRIGPAKPGEVVAPNRPSYDRHDQYRFPNNQNCRVYRMPDAKVRIDGRLDEPVWSQVNVERQFRFPWKDAVTPPTEFMSFYDDQYFYFAFRAVDADIVVYDKLRDKEDIAFEDRAELYFSRDHAMKDYFCLEVDSRGRVFDYRGSYYRRLDKKWTARGVEAAGTTFDQGYQVEGRIPWSVFDEMGFDRSTHGTTMFHCGLYRAEFSHDRSDKPVAKEATIHRPDRMPPEGRLPIEEWISWIDPETPEPDFHVPSSLGRLEIIAAPKPKSHRPAELGGE